MTMLEEAKKYGPPGGDIAVDEEMLELVIAWVHGEVGLHAAAKASGKMKTSFQGMAAGIIRRAAAQGRIKIILLTLVLLLTQISIAQETPHPFWDASQQRGLAVNAVLRGADASVTCFNLSRRNGRERSAPVSSCGGIVAWDAAMVGGEIGTAYLLHRTGHHKLERWAPAVWATPAGVGLVFSLSHMHEK